jgi:hypothetical protein
MVLNKDGQGDDLLLLLCILQPFQDISFLGMVQVPDMIPLLGILLLGIVVSGMEGMYQNF